MNENECVGQADSGRGRSVVLVADYDPRGSGEALIEDFDDDADVSVNISGNDIAGVNVGYPELTQSAVQCWKGKCSEVEEKRAGIAGIW